MSQRPLIIFSLAAVLLAGAAFWFLQTQPKPELPVLPTPTVQVPAASTPPPMETPPPTPVAVGKPPAATPMPEPKAVPEWDAKIDQIITSNAGETETAQMLINLMPS